MWLRRALVIAAFFVAGAPAAACAGDPAPPDGGFVHADLAALVDTVREVHPNPWHGIDEVSFVAAARDLDRRIEGLNRDERLVEAMRLVALLSRQGRDGHQGVWPWWTDMDGYGARTYPLRLWRFPTGLHVVDADPAYRNLVGGRVETLAGHPIADVTAAVDPIVSRDSRHTVDTFGPVLHTIPEILHGLGLLPAVRPADIAVRMPDGATRTARLLPVPMAEFRERSGPAFPLRVAPYPADRPPLWLRDLDVGAALVWLAESRTAYVRFTWSQGTTSPVAEELRALVAAERPERVVVDLRNHLGGDNTAYPSLRDVLRSDAVDRPGRLYALTGRSTFSAAVNFATELERDTSVVFVGEPTGGSPNLYADTMPVKVPSLGVAVKISTRYWEKSTPGDPRLAIEPDLPVPLTVEDWLAGRDPVLAAALA